MSARYEPSQTTSITAIAQNAGQSPDALSCSILDQVPVPMWLSGPDKAGLFFNAAWLRFTGRPMEDHLGEGWIALIHPDDREAALASCLAAFNQRRPFTIQFRLRRHDGVYRWMLDEASPRLLDDGTFGGYIGTCVDVTDTRHAEEACRQSDQRTLRLMETGSVGVILCDAEGAVFYANEAMLRVSGYTRQEVESGAIRWTDVTPAEYLAADARAIAESLEHGSCTPYEKEFIARDGRRVPVLVGGSLYSESADGAPVFAAFVTDLTSLKRTEQSLRDSERRFRTIFNLAAVGIALVSPQGRFLVANQKLCQIVGHSEQQIHELNFHDLSHPEDVPEDLAPLRQLFAGKVETCTFEKWYLRPDGETVCMNVTCSSARDDDGNLDHVLAIVEDITGRKAAEQELVLLNESLEQRVAERTTSLVYYQEQLRALASELTLAEQRERRQLATHLHDYLAQLLIVCRMRLAQSQRHVRSTKAQALLIEVDEVLGKCLKYTRTMISDLSPTILYESGLAVAVRWLGEQMQRHGLRVHVHADRQQIQLQEDEAVLVFDAIRELLFNVIKHAGVDEAKVYLQQAGGQLAVSVRDQGRGFDADLQIRPTDAGKFGLFSVRERLEAMGGRLEVTSAPEEGTTVTLMVPLRPDECEPPVKDKAGEGVEPSAVPAMRIAVESAERGGGIRVLLVDDHDMVREGLRSVIESYSGVEVIAEATNGEEAVQMARSLRPDVVVMDVNMPRMNGIEATRRITHDLPEMRVIGLSVNDDGETTAAMIEAGAAVFLTKGGPSEHLNLAIRAVRAPRPAPPE